MQKIGCGIKSVKGNFDSVKMLMLGGFIAMIKATPHNTTPTKENILGAEQGQGCALKVFARTN